MTQANHASTGLTLPPTLAASPRLNRWVSFETPGRVSLLTGKVELGQGILSAIAQIAAEELDIDYACVDIHPVDSSRSPNEGSTSGSRSIQEGGEATPGLRRSSSPVHTGGGTRVEGRCAATPCRAGRFQGVRGRARVVVLGVVPTSRSESSGLWASRSQAARPAPGGGTVIAPQRPARQAAWRYFFA